MPRAEVPPENAAADAPPDGEPTPHADNSALMVDVVVPVYNEEVDIARNIPTLRDYLSSAAFPYGWRIIIGDNGSTDRTPEVSREQERLYPGQVVYYRATDNGKGRVIKECWETSSADIVSFMDVDLATDLEAFAPLIKPLAEGRADITIGSRLHKKSKVKRSWKRRIMTRVYNTIVGALFSRGFRDAQCGFKAARREAAQNVLPVVQDLHWFFDTEFLLDAERLGYRIKEVPVTWVEDERTSVKLAKTALDDLRGLVRMRLTRPWRSAVRAPERTPDTANRG